jgi:hypothetical protein
MPGNHYQQFLSRRVLDRRKMTEAERNETLAQFRVI